MSAPTIHPASPRAKASQACSGKEHPEHLARERSLRADYDDEGVYVYQAFNDAIADYALERGSFKGCPEYNLNRMTWIKFSFGWMLYRAGFGLKPDQNRILRIKISHEFLREVIDNAVSSDIKVGDVSAKTLCVYQWDPERDIRAEPVPGLRALQLGIRGTLALTYSQGGAILSIEDVTPIAKELREQGTASRSFSEGELTLDEHQRAILKM